MSWVHVGQTVLLVKNLCSLVMVVTFCDNLPLRFPNFLSFALDPEYSTTSLFLFVNNSSSFFSSSNRVSCSLINSLIFFFLLLISFLPNASISSIKDFCISYFSSRVIFLNSNSLIDSFTPLTLSLRTLFIEEKILISKRSSITSLLVGAFNCMNGTKLLLPRITI